MNKFLVLFACFTLCYSYSNAQNKQPPPVIKTTKHTFTEKSLVMDSTGKVLPYKEWKTMITTGEYMLKAKDPENESAGFILYKYSKEPLAARMAHMSQPPQGPYFTNGKPLKPFDIKGIDGFKLRARDWVGKIVVLNFWYIKCVPSKQEIPELNKIVAAHANDKDIVFVAICREEKDKIEKFTKEIPFTYHQVAGGESFPDKLGIDNYPVDVVIDKKGIVRYNSAGYGPLWDKWIAEAIDKCKKEPVVK
jgi:thiol-disulfide isomerase/thioredoxin